MTMRRESEQKLDQVEKESPMNIITAQRRKIAGLLRLFRFELPFAAGVCVVLGSLLALGRLPAPAELALGFFSVFFISAAALILNDYFDIESDRINAPQRPLPAGLVTEQEVVWLAVGVTLLGLGLSYLIGPAALLIAVVVWIIGFLYNWRFKRTGLPGNLMVSFSVGMTFIYGGVVAGQPFVPIVWFFAVLALLINLGEEIAADAMDVAGDRQAQSRSLAIQLGRENALRISGLIFLGIVVISSLPFLFGWLGWVYFWPILVMDMVILYATSKLLDTSLANRRIYIRWIYLSATAALLMIIVLGVFKGN
jgi:geranylgeranylglycerol-phosphate geranylgeranyltransferase